MGKSKFKEDKIWCGVDTTTNRADEIARLKKMPTKCLAEVLYDKALRVVELETENEHLSDGIKAKDKEIRSKDNALELLRHEHNRLAGLKAKCTTWSQTMSAVAALLPKEVGDPLRMLIRLAGLNRSSVAFEDTTDDLGVQDMQALGPFISPDILKDAAERAARSSAAWSPLKQKEEGRLNVESAQADRSAMADRQLSEALGAQGL